MIWYNSIYKWYLRVVVVAEMFLIVFIFVFFFLFHIFATIHEIFFLCLLECLLFFDCWINSFCYILVRRIFWFELWWSWWCVIIGDVLKIKIYMYKSRVDSQKFQLKWKLRSILVISSKFRRNSPYICFRGKPVKWQF